jgi:hypothetical protein
VCVKNVYTCLERFRLCILCSLMDKMLEFEVVRGVVK